MKSADEIVSLYHQRKKQRDPLLARAREITEAYNGDMPVPLPELEESERVAVANLVQSGLDQTAMRIASVMPSVFVPALRPGVKSSEKRARARRGAYMGWWDANRLPLKMRRRARWLIGYTAAPVIMRPDHQRRIPRWEPRNPLAAFPATCLDPDDIHPPDCIFAFRRSREWLKATYPDQYLTLRKLDSTTHFDVLEYADEDEYVTLVIGDKAEDDYEAVTGISPTQVLHRLPNRGDGCPVSFPGRVSLDRPVGQFDGMVGIYQLQAKIMALNVIATQRGIFPETWIVSRDNQPAKVVSVPDPQRGVVGEIQNGQVTTTDINPGVYTNPLLDRLEYAERQTAAIPSEFGGAASSNIRTGRRGAQVISATVDFPIQEAQNIFELALHLEDELAAGIAKGYFGNEARSFHFDMGGTDARTDYIPNRDFETTEHRVSYALAGADANALNIELGQKVGMGSMSKRTAMEKDPMIGDVEAELDRVASEGLFAAFLSGVQTDFANPEGPFNTAQKARIVELVETNQMNLYEAVQKVDEEARELQAQAAEGQMAPADPAMMPGADATEPPAAIEGPQPSQQGLSELLGALRRPQMTLASEGQR